MSAAHEDNILKHFATYTKRIAAGKGDTIRFEPSVLELYRTEQIRQKTAAPINIYSAQHTILFLRGCADQKLCKRRCISNFLNQQHRNYGDLYHVAELCNLFPAYQCKIRTFTKLKEYLKAQHLHLAAWCTLKALHTYDDLSLKRWVKQTIREVGPYYPSWQRYVLARLNVVIMSMSTWNLNLVNIQRTCRNHSWDPKAFFPVAFG